MSEEKREARPDDGDGDRRNGRSPAKEAEKEQERQEDSGEESPSYRPQQPGDGRSLVAAGGLPGMKTRGLFACGADLLDHRVALLGIDDAL